MPTLLPSMMKMQIINKALLLLDNGRSPEAVQLLETFLSGLNDDEESDCVYKIKTAVILADHYGQQPDPEKALSWCSLALELAKKHDSLEDRAGYELKRAKEIEKESKKKS